MSIVPITAAVLLLAAGLAASPAAAADHPVELGRVAWRTDLAAARRESAQTGRPVLILFQEIPGCQGCRDFGAGPISHPLMVEAIEDEFIPVAVNNRGGGANDAILDRYAEPRLNYPVARFVNAEGVDLIPRRDKVWTTGAIAVRMIDALEKAGRRVPGYLRLVAAEHATDTPQTATFAMHCYWEGEANLGRLDGVLTTVSAWRDGLEVVELTYDPAVIAYPILLREAQRMQCASRVYAHTDDQLAAAREVVGGDARPAAGTAKRAKDSDQKFATRQTVLRHLALTPVQATKVNAALRLRKSPKEHLSPRQWALLAKLDRAFEADPESLKDLVPPRKVSEFEAYEKTVRERLAALAKR